MSSKVPARIFLKAPACRFSLSLVMITPPYRHRYSLSPARQMNETGAGTEMPLFCRDSFMLSGHSTNDSSAPSSFFS
jgi:hypothetical protein